MKQQVFVLGLSGALFLNAHFSPARAAQTGSMTQTVNEQVAEALKQGFRDQDSGDDRTSLGPVKLPKLYCARGVDCHDKYVMLVFSSADDRLMCSGVLIAPDLVLTNRHCIAPVTTTPNSPFESWTVTVSLPGAKAQAHASVAALVGNLVAISPENYGTSYGQADWSLLKLNSRFGLPKAKVHFPKLSREGFLQGHEYHIYAQPAWADAKEPDAVERRVCQVRYGNIFAARFTSAGQTVVSLVDCSIGPGNSGAPIYNEREELVGIVGGQMNLGLFQVLNQLIVKDFKLSNRPMGFVGWGVNLACIPDLDHSDWKLPVSCDQNLDPETGRVAIPPPQEQAALDTLNALPLKDSRFRFESRAVPPDETPFVLISQVLFARVPRCVPTEARSKLTTSDLDFVVPLTGLVLSSRGELTHHLAPVTFHRAKLVADLADLRAGRRTKAALTLAGSGVTLMTYELGSCAF